jgi:methylmalonyl-CoA/ethylmalonyl-CoA epimerase
VLPLYVDQLGGRFLHGGENERVGYRGVMLEFAAGTKMEFLEPTPGSSFLDSFFARRPQGGLHHVTFRVTDVRAAAARAAADGLEVVGAFFDDPSWQAAAPVL